MKRRLALLAALSAAAGLSACGNGGEVSHADSEGTSITVGGLQYQVQISRQLNPRDLEDREYLTGVDPVGGRLGNNEVFFAVFLRVKNATSQQQASAGDFTITDTIGEQFRPVPVRNTFAYRPQPLAADATVPNGIEPAAYAPTQGKMLLFKLPNGALDNRPLELEVKSPQTPQQVGSFNLDV